LNAGFNPPLVGKLAQKYSPKKQEIPSFFAESGELVKLTPNLLFHTRLIRQTKEALRRYLQANGFMNFALFCDLVDYSTKALGATVGIL
jgi:hypothetical protein